MDSGKVTKLGAEVRLQAVGKLFGDVHAVREVNLAIEAGSFFTLLGASGSGKTTTLMMVAGFLQPTRGEIFVADRRITNLAPQQRDLGLVFQNYAIFPHLTVFENIAFPLRARGISGKEVIQRVGEMLELIRLPNFGTRMPRQLSGGQQQRVALARALIFGPRVLLMDEPLSALDRKLRGQMQVEIKRIQRHLNVTVIYVTHDQEEALSMSDKVGVMRDGSLEQIGTPGELYEAPATRYVADFIGESTFICGTVTARVGEGNYRFRTDDGRHHFCGMSSLKLEIGAPVVCGVRPEKISVGADIRSDENNCEGTVSDRIYAGDLTRCLVDIGGGTVIVVKIQSRISVPVPALGTKVVLHWQPVECQLFPA